MNSKFPEGERERISVLGQLFNPPSPIIDILLCSPAKKGTAAGSNSRNRRRGTSTATREAEKASSFKGS